MGIFSTTASQKKAQNPLIGEMVPGTGQVMCEPASGARGERFAGAVPPNPPPRRSPLWRLPGEARCRAPTRKACSGSTRPVSVLSATEVPRSSYPVVTPSTDVIRRKAS